MPAKADWKPPPPRRLRAILERLRAEYGRPVPRPHRAPIDELVLTVLSQNTNDRNRDVAYERLRDRFEAWDAVRDAPPEEVEEAIRPGGLAATKAPRIQEILARSATTTCRGWPTSRSREARAELCDAARRGTQDGGVRAAVLLRPAGHPGGHPRVPGGHAAGPVPARARRSRRRTTRCCGWPAARTRTRPTWR